MVILIALITKMKRCALLSDLLLINRKQKFFFSLLILLIHQLNYKFYYRKEGLVFSLLFGQLIPQCLEPDKNIENIICSIRGFGLEHSNYNKVPKINVIVDVFSLINLNTNTSISLRTDRPFASIVQSDNETCTAMYLHCQ